MTHLWIAGQPISILAGLAGIPEGFVWQGQAHPVAGIAGRWRVDTAWWEGRVWRDYLRLYTRTGLLVLLYHDLLTDTWYLQRLYD